jgi:hypothetical protein
LLFRDPSLGSAVALCFNLHESELGSAGTEG